MKWIGIKDKLPDNWSNVECKHENGISKNALHQFKGRFLDMDSKPRIDSMGGTWRDILFNVSEWRYSP